MEAGLGREQAGKPDSSHRRRDQEQEQQQERRKEVEVSSTRPVRRRSSQHQQEVVEGRDDAPTGAGGSSSRSSSNGKGSDRPDDNLGAAVGERISGDAIKTERMGAEAPKPVKCCWFSERIKDGIAAGFLCAGGAFRALYLSLF